MLAEGQLPSHSTQADAHGEERQVPDLEPVHAAPDLPWCNRAFVVGLLFYPSLPGGPRPTDPPPDVALTPRERQELARRDRIEQARGAGGWHYWSRWRQLEPRSTCTSGQLPVPAARGRRRLPDPWMPHENLISIAGSRVENRPFRVKSHQLQEIEEGTR
jgi:hypothetical protein